MCSEPAAATIVLAAPDRHFWPLPAAGHHPCCCHIAAAGLRSSLLPLLSLFFALPLQPGPGLGADPTSNIKAARAAAMQQPCSSHAAAMQQRVKAPCPRAPVRVLPPSLAGWAHQGVVVLNLLHGRLSGQGELDHGVGVQLGQGRRAAVAGKQEAAAAAAAAQTKVARQRRAGHRAGGAQGAQPLPASAPGTPAAL